MDEDDPEKRISELERRLAAPRTAGRPGSLTPELVRNVAFAKPPIGKRGYNEDEVDAFLDLVAAALRDPAGRPLTPQQVRDVAFAKPPIGKRGYNEDEVDAFLDLVGEHLQLAGALRPPPPSAIAPPPVDRPTARHAEPESWLRRVVNAVIQFFGSDD
jgi:DivIVA domain-containing protein